MRVLYGTVAVLYFATMMLPAEAQINPFKGNQAGETLSATDLDLLGGSIDRLNRNPKLEAGAKDEWSNPATASHGSSEVTRVFKDGRRQCHAMHHEIFAQGKTSSRGYDLTWCRTSDGKWKIKS